MKTQTRSLARTLISSVLIAWLLLGRGLPALAHGPAEAGFPTPTPDGPTDPTELETFLDSVLTAQLEEEHVAGAVVAVVKDGRLFFSKGYGYADVEHGIPVDPQTTLFRIASITKLFTWTAVMQLVEQGRLDLDADVNTYLDFRIPATLGDGDEDDEDASPLPPITLAHLLTHTPGFEDRVFETVVEDSADLMPLGEWLASHIPARVRPPGELTAYSNYGTALSGYIVERVSGLSYEQYVAQNILTPLGMTHTTAQRPLPAELAADMSLGYYFDGDVFQSVPFELGQDAPAGAISASADDMARFMVAHLQDGRYDAGEQGAQRILQEAAARQMHTAQLRHHPSLNGLGYGFVEMSQSCVGLHDCDGQRIVGHDGSTLLFHSTLALLPEQGLGLFAAYNSENGDPGVLLEAFLDHYYPLPQPDLSPRGDLAGRFAGSYRPSRSAYTTVEKMFGLTQVSRMRDAGDGTLMVTTPWAQMHFVEVEPLLFRQVDGDEILAFRADDRGHITHAFFNSEPAVTLEKLAWYEAPTFHFILLGAGGIVLQSVLVVAVIIFVRSRRQKANGGASSWPRPARAAGWLLVSMAVLNLVTVVLLLISAPNLVLSLMTGKVAGLKIALALNIVMQGLVLGSLVMAVVVWKQGYWTLGGRVYYTLVLLTGLLSLWSLDYWHLIGWAF